MQGFGVCCSWDCTLCDGCWGCSGGCGGDEGWGVCEERLRADWSCERMEVEGSGGVGGSRVDMKMGSSSMWWEYPWGAVH